MLGSSLVIFRRAGSLACRLAFVREGGRRTAATSTSAIHTSRPTALFGKREAPWSTRSGDCPTRDGRTGSASRGSACGSSQLGSVSRAAASASTRATVLAASSPSADANCAAPSSLWKAQPPSRPTPIRAAGTRREMFPKSVAKGRGGGSSTKPRPAARKAVGHCGRDSRIGPDAGHDPALLPGGVGQRGVEGGRPLGDARLVVCPDEERGVEHRSGALFDVTVQQEALQHDLAAAVPERSLCAHASRAACSPPPSEREPATVARSRRIHSERSVTVSMNSGCA